jgi:hypothetical protein
MVPLQMDANTGTSITTDRELQEFLRSTNLIDAVTTRHQEQYGLQPTHHNGRYPIAMPSTPQASIVVIQPRIGLRYS